MRIRIVLLFCSALISAPVQSALFCVTNSGELEAALDTAEGNGQNDVIRLASGNYDSPASGFRYTSTQTEDFDLEISGGWSSLLDNPCAIRFQDAPASQINGQSINPGMDVFLRDSSVLRISRLAFINGFGGDVSRGTGLSVRAELGFNGEVHIERNLFFNNVAQYSAGLYIGLDAAGPIKVFVINNVFRLNRARFDNGAGSIGVNGGFPIPGQAFLAVVNNTVVNNFVDFVDFDETGGLRIGGWVPFTYIVNNHLWGNQGVDLNVSLTFNAVYDLFNNNVEDGLYGAPPVNEAGNLSLQPAYEPCQGLLCFSGVPLPDSALHDSGRQPQAGDFWVIGEFDYRGKARSHNDRVDIGAFESHARFFSDRFEGD